MANLYDFVDWSPVETDGDRLVYQPSGRTLVRRLGSTLLAGLVIGLVVYSFGFPPDGQSGHIATVLYWSVFGMCVAVGVLVPLSSVWQRLTFEEDIRGDLCVTRQGLMRSSRSFPKRGMADLLVVVGEVYHRQRRPHIEKFLGWRWQVQIRVKADRTDADELVVFWPDMTDTLPPQLSKMTRRGRAG